MLQSVRGLVRFHLVRLEPDARALRLAGQLRPRGSRSSRSATRRTTPAELADAIGTFHTTGMVEDHAGLNNERIGEEAFLDQCDLAWREREAMMLHELERFDEGLFYCLFDTPDRVQHLFWRLPRARPPGQPRPDAPARARAGHRGPVPPGRRGRRQGPASSPTTETLVIVLSDHGFGSFRRGVNLNTLLHDEGLLALRDGVKPGRGGRRPAPRRRLVADQGLRPRAGRDLPEPRGPRGAGHRQARGGRGARRRPSPGG